jgi:hypothetical protein
MPQGGHSKSPNSSICTGAFAGPSTWGGSAPGTPLLATGCCVTGLCAPGDDAGCWPPTAAPEEGTVRVKYHTLPSTMARTARIIRNGSIRFIWTRTFKLPLQESRPVSGKYRDRRLSRASLRKHVPGAALTRVRCVAGCRCLRCYHATRLDSPHR